MKKTCNTSSKRHTGTTISLQDVADLHISGLLELPENEDDDDGDGDDDPWSNSVVTCLMSSWPTRQWYLGVAGVVAMVRNSLEAIDLRRM